MHNVQCPIETLFCCPPPLSHLWFLVFLQMNFYHQCVCGDEYGRYGWRVWMWVLGMWFLVVWFAWWALFILWFLIFLILIVPVVYFAPKAWWVTHWLLGLVALIVSKENWNTLFCATIVSLSECLWPWDFLWGAAKLERNRSPKVIVTNSFSLCHLQPVQTNPLTERQKSTKEERTQMHCLWTKWSQERVLNELFSQMV